MGQSLDTAKDFDTLTRTLTKTSLLELFWDLSPEHSAGTNPGPLESLSHGWTSDFVKVKEVG